MNKAPSDLVGAQIEIERARARLTATMSELHGRLKPDVLVRESVDRLRERSGELADEAMDVVRARPALIGGIGAGMLLVWLRRPLTRLGRRLFSRTDETDLPADQLQPVDKR